MPDPVLYFVSDTHLCDGTGADRFLYPKELMALLRRIEAEPQAHLVLLGDFLELWACSLEAVMVQYAPILKQLGRLAQKHPVTYVVGNHDSLPWYYFLGQHLGQVRLAERFTTADGRLVALHGHQYDPFNQVAVESGKVKEPWSRKLVEVIGFLGRVGGDAVGDAIQDVGHALSQTAGQLERLLPHWEEQDRQAMGECLRQTRDVLYRESPGERGYPVGEKLYENAARRLVRGGARWVLMGHTHHPLVRQFDKGVYVNTGSWVWDRYGPTYARFAGKKLELLDGRTHRPYHVPGP